MARAINTPWLTAVVQVVLRLQEAPEASGCSKGSESEPRALGIASPEDRGPHRIRPVAVGGCRLFGRRIELVAGPGSFVTVLVTRRGRSGETRLKATCTAAPTTRR